MHIEPIGVYLAPQIHPYEAARQPRGDRQHEGEIQLNHGHGFEQALLGLEGFDRIWLIFQFHHNSDWKPMVRPPRGTDRKVGVFATRAPYRPNGLGLSCVRLKEIKGLSLIVEGADLLNGTPIFDIKPYLPEADSFPNAKMGWLEGVTAHKHQIRFSAIAENQIRWLEQSGLIHLRDFLEQQLEFEPFDQDRKRVSQSPENLTWTLAYRTWRADFHEVEPQILEVQLIRSGYSDHDLNLPDDRWKDKDLHRRFAEAMASFFKTIDSPTE